VSMRPSAVQKTSCPGIRDPATLPETINREWKPLPGPLAT
jgi:hypothetical protein